MGVSRTRRALGDDERLPKVSCGTHFDHRLTQGILADFASIDVFLLQGRYLTCPVSNQNQGHVGLSYLEAN